MTEGERALGAAAAPALAYDDYMAYDANRGGNLRELMNYGLPEAYQRSGIYQSPPGARAGYEDYGFPAPIYQTEPYATATGRMLTMPNGGLGWQALQGFPSAYPHVLNGVPRDFWSIIGPYMPPLWQMPTWQPPAPRQAVPRAAAPVSRGGAAPVKQAAATPPAEQPVLTPGNYDETTWRNRPLPPVQQPELKIPMAPAHFWGYGAAGHGNFTPPSWGNEEPSAPAPFVPQLMTPEEAAANAGIDLPPAPAVATPITPERRARAEQILFPQGKPAIPAPAALAQPQAQLPITPIPQVTNPLGISPLPGIQPAVLRQAREYGGYLP